MKRNFLLLLLPVLLLLVGCADNSPHYLIGVSQCSDDDWRTQLNNEIRRESQFYDNVTVEIRAANDDNARQMADIEQLVALGVDLLIVSPNVVEDVTPAIMNALDKGIPVVLVDRRTNSEECTAYVGADNYDIGRRAGDYIANRLGGKGKMVEITGLIASAPAIERHRGFREVINNYADISVVSMVDAGWTEQQALEAFDTILDNHSHIDLVFAHNDRMAAGAYRAAVKHGREKEMHFIGVDALYGEGKGVDMVVNGQLDATFIYPTGGDKVMQVAMDILQGREYEYKNMLSTALVNKANARTIQMQMAQIATLDNKVGTLNRQLDTFFTRYSMQRVLLVACSIALVVVLASLFFVVRAFWAKKRLNEELNQQKLQLEQQKAQLEKQRDNLIELSKQLEQATHAKLMFFTNISHDLRTPLTLISDPAEQLAKSGSLSADDHFLADIVRKNARVLLRLVNQLLDFRKYEEGKQELHPSKIDFSKELASWSEAFRTLSYSKHIAFTVTVKDADEGYDIVADAEKLERIVYNLLSNAFKFTPNGGAVAVSLARNASTVRLQVSDTGCGIGAEHIAHIFDEFYQSRSTAAAGSGIGLSLTKAFVEMHGGSIWVESEEGHGSTFTVELPVEQLQVEPSHEPQGSITQGLHEPVLPVVEPKTQDGEHDTTVLIIDDNEDMRNYMRKLLQNDGCGVVEAADGQEGLTMALKHVPDVIVCDVMMPVMDGIECCRRLKAELQTSHIPVIMLTAYGLDEYKQHAYECGADSYITKPFGASILLARVRNLLENRQRLQNFFGYNPEGSNKAKSATSLGEIDKSFLDKLYEQIDQHIAEADFSVEELGSQLGLSRVQLYRKTKALTGHSPNEVLRIARLKRAASLLASTDKTVAEICYAVGFASPSYFTKCYKEAYGESPTDFLKRKSGV